MAASGEQVPAPDSASSSTTTATTTKPDECKPSTSDTDSDAAAECFTCQLGATVPIPGPDDDDDDHPGPAPTNGRRRPRRRRPAAKPKSGGTSIDPALSAEAATAAPPDDDAAVAEQVFEFAVSIRPTRSLALMKEIWSVRGLRTFLSECAHFVVQHQADPATAWLPFELAAAHRASQTRALEFLETRRLWRPYVQWLRRAAVPPSESDGVAPALPPLPRQAKRILLRLNRTEFAVRRPNPAAPPAAAPNRPKAAADPAAKAMPPAPLAAPGPAMRPAAPCCTGPGGECAAPPPPASKPAGRVPAYINPMPPPPMLRMALPHWTQMPQAGPPPGAIYLPYMFAPNAGIVDTGDYF